MISTDRLAEMAAEIERLRARITELQDLMADAYMRSSAAAAVTHGTMGTLQPDEPATITHNHPPSAPPYNE